MIMRLVLEGRSPVVLILELVLLAPVITDRYIPLFCVVV